MSRCFVVGVVVFVFVFNDTATTEIYTLSLHDALPISHTLVKKDAPRDMFGDVVAASIARIIGGRLKQCIGRFAAQA